MAKKKPFRKQAEVIDLPQPGVAEELEALYRKRGALDPHEVVAWAEQHPGSALHARFNWDDTDAARKWRLHQARMIITEVEVVYPDGKKRQVYVSPVESRGNGGYASLVEVMSDDEKRAAFLEQALDEYRRLGERYKSLQELAAVRAEVARAARGRRRRAA